MTKQTAKTKKGLWGGGASFLYCLSFFVFPSFCFVVQNMFGTCSEHVRNTEPCGTELEPPEQRSGPTKPSTLYLLPSTKSYSNVVEKVFKSQPKVIRTLSKSVSNSSQSYSKVVQTLFESSPKVIEKSSNSYATVVRKLLKRPSKVIQTSSKCYSKCFQK